MTASRTIQRLAIVNRGEAAMRCIRAVKALRAAEGSRLEVVALYTRVDRDAPFVRHADQSFLLASEDGNEAQAYLDHEGLLEALKRARVDAVWPGWGFVAEDPAFVEKLERAGILFLGPSPDAMQRLGDKISSKRIAEAAGVPVTPWSGGVVANEEEAAVQGEKLGYPLVVKASAGGGGRGIRMVEHPADLAEAFRSAASEAAGAFGDDRLFIEQKVTGGRHIEVQIVADEHGFVVALGCRDCSVQRRHQKLLEETPPPGVSQELLENIESSAVKIARSVSYHGVGTVEYLVSGDSFAFLEMNPRLQVEHGITEAITGVDLVEIQIRIARGESLEGLVFVQRGVAIEARVCAEDPDAGFLPAPGRIARFDPALGPRVRIDTGVTAGSTVPASFDSLIAKVIASGKDRKEARAQLACALLDFDLVIEGGATNKGFLLDVLASDDYRRGGVDTEWLDRFVAEQGPKREFAVEALVAAGILSYQNARQAARINFYADTSNIAADRVPPSGGQQIDLTHHGESYRLEVFAVGSWRYRIHCDDRVVEAALREEGQHTARLRIGDRTLRVVYDATESGLRVEVEGRPHYFSNQSAGHVRAGTPAIVVTIHVEPGDRVQSGQTLGVLEAMKTEIGFDSPVSGMVTEVRVRRGQQVAAGDVLLVIDPASDDHDDTATAGRLELIEVPDSLSPLFAGGQPDLVGADRTDPDRRRAAIETVRGEVRRVLLGYDANEERAEKLASFLDAPLPEDLSEAFLRELAEIRRELEAFADVDQLFIRAPGASVGGELGPSNNARLRMYVRRMHAGGVGIEDEFLDLVKEALAHYGVTSLEHSDALERAVLRMLASQLQAGLRHRLVLAVLHRVTELAARGVHLSDDRRLEWALGRVTRMRGLVSDAVADAAADAAYSIFEGPRIERLAERTSKQLEIWLAEAESKPTAPPEDVLLHLADAPRQIFDRVGRWLSASDPRRRVIAMAAWLRRTYSPLVPVRQISSLAMEGGFDRYEFEDGRIVLSTACEPLAIGREAERLLALASQTAADDTSKHAVELYVPVHDGMNVVELLAPLSKIRESGMPGIRLTVNVIPEEGECLHYTFESTTDGLREVQGYHGIHPETARRIDLDRLAKFDLERIPAHENIYCFYGRSTTQSADERIFVLGDARSRSPDDGREAALHLPAFEHTFYEATRALRSILRIRDPKRRLQWNRIALFVSPAIYLDPDIARTLSRRLAPATRNLGLEKVVVRLDLLDREEPTDAAVPIEFVISDITGSNMEIRQRSPHTAPLEPASDYERSIVEARRRRLIYPYEIIRMLTGSGKSVAPAAVGADWELPIGKFEEFDLDVDCSTPKAISVADRPFGVNESAIVFGIVSTPTDKVPEGMKRVLVLSDPTHGMGSLAGPECDRIVAAIDLAEERSLPVEWLPVSSGARISMDSGTENLDATARVVRRIVQFTQDGGVIHLIVSGVNVGAQSYWDALATMLMHNRGALIMTPRASMVLTGRAALEASGGVSAEDEPAIGGFERIMGPNGEAQYFANDLGDAFRILYEHYRFTYVVPGESGPRLHPTKDPTERSIADIACAAENGNGDAFKSVGEIFDDETNPGRKRPFPMRAVMQAVIDQDGGHLERWRSMVGAETAIIWDAHIGGHPICLIGIESTNVTREGYRSLDGPSTWNAGTLFPLSSKKVARAINAASGNRSIVVLANLSGFDGSPESMRKLQLEYGAEIARAVVNFDGPIIFLVVSRYHGGAYVVFSQELNPQLKAAALEGSYASVIGGVPAAAVVFGREVRARALADPKVAELERVSRIQGTAASREDFERTLADAILEQQAEVAAEFDAIHTVERARDVGSLSEIVDPKKMRAYLVSELQR